MRIELRTIESDRTWSDFVVVRLLRRWSAVRALGDHALPSLVSLSTEMGETPHLAVSLHSLFQLTESCLARPLEAECCCSAKLAPDERAILALLANVRPGMPRAPAEIPHGLPAALVWAAASARMMLSGSLTPVGATSCPFESAASAVPN